MASAVIDQGDWVHRTDCLLGKPANVYVRACACACVRVLICACAWAYSQLKDREVVLRVLNVSNLARSCSRVALTHVRSIAC